MSGMMDAEALDEIGACYGEDSQEYAHFADLIAERDALAADARRYRWLRQYAEQVKANGRAVDWEWEQDRLGVDDYTLDAAIDRAQEGKA